MTLSSNRLFWIKMANPPRDGILAVLNGLETIPRDSQMVGCRECLFIRMMNPLVRVIWWKNCARYVNHSTGLVRLFRLLRNILTRRELTNPTNIWRRFARVTEILQKMRRRYNVLVQKLRERNVKEMSHRRNN